MRPAVEVMAQPLRLAECLPVAWTRLVHVVRSAPGRAPETFAVVVAHAGTRIQALPRAAEATHVEFARTLPLIFDGATQVASLLNVPRVGASALVPLWDADADCTDRQRLADDGLVVRNVLAAATAHTPGALR